MVRNPWRVSLAILLLAEAALLTLAVQRTFDDRPVLVYETIAIVVFAGAVGALARSGFGRPTGLRLVLGSGAALQLLVLTRKPVDSDDDFRYLWDAKVQLAGIDPYRFTPSSSALAGLRDNALFPQQSPCHLYALPGGACTHINLPTVHTIYPPAAEAIFALIRILSLGGRGGHLPLQLAAALGALVIAALLARDRRPLWTVALWAWCPVTVMELGNNAHIDWMAVLFAVLALTVTGTRRPFLSGLLLGAGIATKLYPALVGPALVKRRPWLVIGGAALTVVLSYLPHVVAVGGSVLGYLPSYLNQGGYGSGDRYHLLHLVLPKFALTPVAMLLMVALISWAVLCSDPLHPERAALAVVGGAVLVTTPTLPWYTLLLLALAALNSRPEWLGVVVAPTVEYLVVGVLHANLDDATTIAYLAGLLVLLTGTGVRRLRLTKAPLVPAAALSS